MIKMDFEKTHATYGTYRDAIHLEDRQSHTEHALHVLGA